MDSTKALNLIAEAITEHWGERCPDFDGECFCCKVWSEYDRLTALAEQGEAPQPAADGLEPTHWHCKDYADGWISFDNAGEALAYQRDTGCLLRVIYRPSQIREQPMSGESSGTYQNAEEYNEAKAATESLLAAVEQVAVDSSDAFDDWTLANHGVTTLRRQYRNERDEAHAEIASLQQQLSDCKSSLRAVEAERESLKAQLKHFGQLHEQEYRQQVAAREAAEAKDAIRQMLLDDALKIAAAAEAREKQLKAGLERILNDDRIPPWVHAVFGSALASKEGGK